MTLRAATYRGARRFTLDACRPTPPGPGEVEVAVAYAGICGTDLHVYAGHMDARVGTSRVIGHEMSGTVARLGEGVSHLAVGQAVVVRPLRACGACPACREGYAHICHTLKFMGLDTDGAFQERWTVPAETLHAIPEGVPLDHAALVEPLAVAVHDVRRARLQAGETALVVGGGPIGMLIALVAREAGAEVIVSEIAPRRRAFAEDLGLATVDPAAVEIGPEIAARTGGKGADVVFEVSGSQAGVDAMTAAAATRGRIVMVAIHATKPQVDLFRFFWRELEMVGARVYEPADYDAAIALLAEGRIPAATLITDVCDLSEIEAAFAALKENPVAMKTLLKIGRDQ
jgi:(R,R)-butanediol dehydrogenase/meso-butanediol dehydrogenase/diacetyl reductase